jgi:repressor of nif and glnA expression
MTTVSEAARTGNGKILANFREIPAPARAIAQEVITSLKEAGIIGVYALGNISEPICQIAIGLNRVGMVLLGGLNPVAAAVEAGIEVENIAESGIIDFEQLKSFWQLYELF